MSESQADRLKQRVHRFVDPIDSMNLWLKRNRNCSFRKITYAVPIVRVPYVSAISEWPFDHEYVQTSK